MSQSEVERFAADLRGNAGLRAEAVAHTTRSQEGTALARAVVFAVSKGYKFTLEHARAHVKATAWAAGRQLSDAEIDNVAGGDIGFVSPF